MIIFKYTLKIVCAAEAEEMEDLTHLVGPLTEESIVRCLQARFHNSHYEVNTHPRVTRTSPTDDHNGDDVH